MYVHQELTLHSPNIDLHVCDIGQHTARRSSFSPPDLPRRQKSSLGAMHLEEDAKLFLWTRECRLCEST